MSAENDLSGHTTRDYIATACDVQLAPLFQGESAFSRLDIDPDAIATIYDSFSSGQTLAEPLLFVASHAQNVKRISTDSELYGRYVVAKPGKRYGSAKRRTGNPARVEVNIGGGIEAYENVSEEEVMQEGMGLMLSDPDFRSQITARDNTKNMLRAYKTLAQLRPRLQSPHMIQETTQHELKHAVNAKDVVMAAAVKAFRKHRSRVFLGTSSLTAVTFMGVEFGIAEAFSESTVPTITACTAAGAGIVALYRKTIGKYNQKTGYAFNPNEIDARKAEKISDLPQVISFSK